MTRLVINISFALSSLLASNYCDGQNSSEKLSLLAESLSGHFETRDSLSVYKNHYEVHMNTSRIWKYRKDGYWLYEEQASADQLNIPYAQQVYRVYQRDTVFIFEIYAIINSRRYAGAYLFKKPLNDLRKDSLRIRIGCEVYLVHDKGRFVGKTRDRMCTSEIHGAAYATKEIEIKRDTLQVWDRGFSDKGDQIWGPSAGPLIFIRTNKKGDH